MDKIKLIKRNKSVILNDQSNSVNILVSSRNSIKSLSEEDIIIAIAVKNNEKIIDKTVIATL
jgi:hypothetical protein